MKGKVTSEMETQTPNGFPSTHYKVISIISWVNSRTNLFIPSQLRHVIETRL